MYQLLTYGNKTGTGLCQIKRSSSYLLDSPHRLSELIFPICEFQEHSTYSLHQHKYPSLVENPVSHGRKVRQQLSIKFWISSVAYCSPSSKRIQRLFAKFASQSGTHIYVPSRINLHTCTGSAKQKEY